MTILYMNGFESLPSEGRVDLSIGRATGKSLTATEALEGLVNDFDGDVILGAAETIKIQENPTFTWTERYKISDDIRGYFTNFWGLFHAYMGETNPRGWLPPIRRCMPFRGDRLHRRARILEAWNPVTMRPPRRFWVPAHRFAGFAAYPYMDGVRYLEQPKHGDWSHELYVEETSFSSWRYRPGKIVITYPEDFGGWKTINDVGSLRPSERRARYSSTMDGNGKPRKKKR
jgi:hypothetical protein